MSDQTKRIVTLTLNPALDMSTSVDQVVPEHKLRCGPPTYEPGGGGINVARAVQHLGGKALACYVAGGHTGDHFQTLLNEAGIEQERVWVEGALRESVSVFENQSTQQYRFNLPGSPISAEERARVLAVLEGLEPSPDLLVVSGSLPPEMPGTIFANLAEIVAGHGAKLIVDSSGSGLEAALDAGVYLIKPNFRELGELTDQSIQDDSELEAVCHGLIRDGAAQAVVVSLGAGGAVLVSGEETVHYRAPTVPIQSKVGAGDSMVGGTVLALAKEQTLEDAVRFGVASGAAAVMTPGSELCRREDAERLYAQMLAG